MPPKKPTSNTPTNATKASGNKAGASKKEILASSEEGMQAVVFLDSHDQRLDPLTIDTPKVCNAVL